MKMEQFINKTAWWIGLGLSEDLWGRKSWDWLRGMWSVGKEVRQVEKGLHVRHVGPKYFSAGAMQSSWRVSSRIVVYDLYF